MLRRLFPSRWARIVAWTGAAVAWGTSVVAVQAVAEQGAVDPQVPVPAAEPEVEEMMAPAAAVPAAPEQGLVIIRYTPVPPPPPEVITRTVSVGGGTGGGNTGASSGGGVTSRPTINDVVSSGS